METDTDQRWLLNVAQVADITTYKTTTVRAAIRDGKLAAGGDRRRGYVITRAAVAAWLGLPVEDIRSRCSDNEAGDGAAA